MLMSVPGLKIRVSVVRFRPWQNPVKPSASSASRQRLFAWGEAMRDMIENGMGIGMKSLWNASESLQSGTLVEVLPDYALKTESAIWALYPNRRIVAPKVRAMIDFLVEQFSPVPS